MGRCPTFGLARIEYTLAQPARVRISVHDVQGRLVALPVNEMRPAGRHEATWDDARSARAGFYFVRFEAAGRSETKRLVLIR